MGRRALPGEIIAATESANQRPIATEDSIASTQRGAISGNKGRPTRITNVLRIAEGVIFIHTKIVRGTAAAPQEKLVSCQKLHPA